MTRNSLYTALFILLFGCNSNEPITAGVYIFLDVTDGLTEIENTIENDLKQISNFANLSEDTGGNNGIEVKIFQINNLSESNSKTIILEKGIPGMLGQNSLDRADEIKKFNSEIRNNLISIKSKNSIELENSKIYQNLCRELNGLNFNNEKNLIVIYSDMLENSRLFSFYKNKDRLSKWNEDISLAIKYLETRDCSFPKLENIEIHIISKRRIENDELINKAQFFWANFFKAKGAILSFDSELNLKTQP